MYFMDDWRPLALWRAINIINEGRSQIRDYQIRACSAEKSHCCPGVYHTFKACLKGKYHYSYVCWRFRIIIKKCISNSIRFN